MRNQKEFGRSETKRVIQLAIWNMNMESAHV